MSELASRGLKRSLISPSGIDFSSNDYHPFSKSKDLQNRLINYLSLGKSIGSTGSRLISGNTEVHEEVEKFFGDLYSPFKCLFFGSGYLANLGVIGALASLMPLEIGFHIEVFSDALYHASLIDGIRLTRVKPQIYHHNDLNHLEKLLKKNKHTLRTLRVIITESIFSMDGDSPDLEELVKIATRYNTYLIVDETHATGVSGEKGLGLLTQYNLDYNKTFIIHSGAKGLGGYGAFVLSSEKNKNYLINNARTFIYSTAPSPLHLLQAQWAMTKVISEPNYLQSLNANIKFMNLKSPIGTVPIAGSQRALMVADELQNENYFVRAIRYPTVPEGTERIRFTIKSAYNERDYNQFKKVLNQILESSKQIYGD